MATDNLPKGSSVAATLAMVAQGLLNGSLVCIYMLTEAENEKGLDNGGRLRLEIVLEEVAIEQVSEEDEEPPEGPLH